MRISVRLDDQAERIVRRLSKRTGRTKSDVIRQAIAALDRQQKPACAEAPSAYDGIAHLVGGAGSRGARRLSENTGDHFRQIVEMKHRTRRRRFSEK